MAPEPGIELQQKADPEEAPPVFGTWRRFYIVVVVNTLLTYLLLLLFSYYTVG
jgi:hypothetical protein